MEFETQSNEHGFRVEIKGGNPTTHLLLRGKGREIHMEVETEGWYDLAKALAKVTDLWVEQDMNYRDDR